MRVVPVLVALAALFPADASGQNASPPTPDFSKLQFLEGGWTCTLMKSAHPSMVAKSLPLTTALDARHYAAPTAKGTESCDDSSKKT